MAKSKRQRDIAKRRQEANRMMKLPSGKFKEMSPLQMQNAPDWMNLAYRNNRYIVMISTDQPTTKGPAIMAMIQNHFNTPIKNHWRVIQEIKNEIFGDEVTAIEYYPAQKDVVDMANIYWIWIFNDPDVLPLPILTKEQKENDDESE